jgi:hypothetical protein
LAENPSVSEESLDELAVAGSRSVVETLLASTRVMNSAQLLQALQSNVKLRPKEFAEIGKRLAALGVSPIAEPQAREVDATDVDASDEVLDGTVAQYLLQNEAELEAEKDKPFRPIGIEDEDVRGEAAGEIRPLVPTATGGAIADAATSAPGKAAAAAIHGRKHTPAGREDRRVSALHKISKLDIKSRIALAVRGTKEDRSILIRDSTKLVAVAVLESPKVSDSEVEAFALQKNVLDSVLRAIPLKRRFAKNYAIMRNLVYNPRTPIDASLPLMKGLLIHDLKNLSGNKEVSDTIRKVALRLFRQRLEKKG